VSAADILDSLRNLVQAVGLVNDRFQLPGFDQLPQNEQVIPIPGLIATTGMDAKSVSVLLQDSSAL
jgi:hypothetical protein